MSRRERGRYFPERSNSYQRAKLPEARSILNRLRQHRNVEPNFSEDLPYSIPINMRHEFYSDSYMENPPYMENLPYMENSPYMENAPYMDHPSYMENPSYMNNHHSQDILPPNEIPEYNNEPEIDPGPRPLIPPETVEQLRASLNLSGRRFIGDYEEEEDDDEEDSRGFEPMDREEYLKEEEKTKRQIEEIIEVAQALREKLEREETMRRAGYEPVRDYDYDAPVPCTPPSPPHERPLILPNPNLELFENPEPTPGKIPSLLELKPKIPSLLDLYVPPPPVEKVVKERIIMASQDLGADGVSMEKCWNCLKSGHKYVNCALPHTRQFCFRCGRAGFDVSSCPYCKLVLSD